MEKGNNQEYEQFILWRCRFAEEKCKKYAIENNIDTESDLYREMLMIECYNKGFTDKEKLGKYAL